ncbi:hypothetical protein FK481_0106 [Listeria phage LP-010]|uniref:Uncharacterized protein n=2 Tax=Homburgvirus LP114 TaxID=1921129 RepID=A0A514U6X6_9CAUD|nr:hypothetical protein FK481_0106 [Listeria phage LP-010]
MEVGASMQIGAVIWGLQITEWVALIGLVTGLFSGLAWLFKRIVASPFMDRFDNLTSSMDNLASQLDESKQDRMQIHIRINKTNTRVDKIEGRADKIETRLDYIEEDIKEVKHTEGYKR